MKLIQLNMWGGRLENKLQHFFASEQPDIACLQESISIYGNGAIFVPPEILQKSWNRNTYLFHSPVFTFKLMARNAHFGNSIISTIPFADRETIFTNLEHKVNFDFELDDYNIRNLQHAAFDINGSLLHVLNHHGHHIPEHKNGNADTLRQMRKLCEYIQTLNGPVILTGDFNLAPRSKSLELINQLLNNLSMRHKLGTTRTSLTYKKEVCDYVFVNHLVEVTHFQASEELVSDHKPLILEFELKA